jgi:predicted Zn-dependent protease
VFSSSSALFAGENYNQAWKSFSSNDRASARKLFQQAASENASDAYLSLCLLEWNDNNFPAAWDAFTKFYSSSQNPYPYLYAVSALEFFRDESVMKNPENVKLIQTMIADPKINGTIKAMLYEKLGAYYRSINKHAESKAMFDKVGNINKWQVLGSFDNTSGSGFAKDWGALEKAKTTDVFINNSGAEVKWFTPPYNREDNWFLFDYSFNINNSIVYAQSFVTCPDDREVFLRVGTSGSLKTWINDALVMSVMEERNCDIDVYATKVKLNKGVNRVLVQIGSSEIEKSNFLLRFTDENANPYTDIAGSDVYADYKKSVSSYSDEQIEFFAEKYLINKLKNEPDNQLTHLLLAETYLRNDKAYEATKVLKNLEELKGKSTILSRLLYEAYLRADNQTDYEKEAEEIRQSDPDAHFSLLKEYGELIESEKYDEAETVLKKLVSLYGENKETELLKLGILSLQKKFDEVISLAKSMYKKYPDDYKLMQINYNIVKNVNKNPAGAVKIIKDFSKNNYNEDALALLYKEYFSQGKAVEGLKVQEEMLARSPYATGFMNNIIQSYFQMQQYQMALPYVEKGFQMAPYIPFFHNISGELYKNMKQDDKAKESFKKAIYYAPTSYDARTQLRLLEGKPQVFDVFPKINVKDSIAKAPTASDYPDDHSVYVVNSFQQVVYPEGAKEYRRIIAIKILKQPGIEYWKEYGIGYNGYLQNLMLDKAEVIKANGSVVKAETDDNQVVFTNLEVNDVLYLDYRIQDFSKGKLATHFYDNFLFQYSIPAVSGSYALLVPQDKKFDYKVTNGDVKPEISAIENLNLYQWKVSKVPAVKSESDMSAYMDVLPTLYYSSISDWSFISDWYKDITTSKFNPDFVLKETYAKVMKGNEQKSPQEKAKLIYQYIQDNINYSSVDFLQSNFIPQKASRTITTRLGDCKDLSTLFVALCRMAGVDANLVLILTRDNGSKTLQLPEVGFNHCIARVNLPEGGLYVELTDNALPFGAAVKEDVNAQILNIPAIGVSSTEKLTSLQTPKKLMNGSVRYHQIYFKGNTDLIIDRKINYGGLLGAYERGQFRNVGEDDQFKEKSESVAGQFKMSSKMSKLKFTGLEDLSDTVSVEYSVELKNAIQQVAGLKILTLPWSDTNSLDLVSLDSRTYPLEYWSYQVEDQTTEIMTINLPVGVKLAEAPQNIQYSCPSAAYSLKFDTSKPSKLIITRYFERKQDVIPPADYAAFKDFMIRVSESDNKQLGLK